MSSYKRRPYIPDEIAPGSATARLLAQMIENSTDGGRTTMVGLEQLLSWTDQPKFLTVLRAGLFDPQQKVQLQLKNAQRYAQSRTAAEDYCTSTIKAIADAPSPVLPISTHIVEPSRESSTYDDYKIDMLCTYKLGTVLVDLVVSMCLPENSVGKTYAERKQTTQAPMVPKVAYLEIEDVRKALGLRRSYNNPKLSSYVGVRQPRAEHSISEREARTIAAALRKRVLTTVGGRRALFAYLARHMQKIWGRSILQHPELLLAHSLPAIRVFGLWLQANKALTTSELKHAHSYMTKGAH